MAWYCCCVREKAVLPIDQGHLRESKHISWTVVIGLEPTSDTLGFLLDCRASLLFALQFAPGNILLNPKLEDFVVGEASSELAMFSATVALSARVLLILSAGHPEDMSFPSVRKRMSGSLLAELFRSSCY